MLWNTYSRLPCLLSFADNLHAAVMACSVLPTRPHALGAISPWTVRTNEHNLLDVALRWVGQASSSTAVVAVHVLRLSRNCVAS